MEHGPVCGPARDRVLIVDLPSQAVHDVALSENDEPGRVALDDHAVAHVVLRRAGLVASIDMTTRTVRERRSVCAAPQGIATSGSTLYITCAGGEIVTLPTAAAGKASVLAHTDRDLRDVVVQGDALLVSRLRSAEVLRVAKADGVILARAKPAVSNANGVTSVEPFVGYRLAATPTGAMLVHQVGTLDVVQVELPQAYSSADPCGGPVTTTISTFESTGPKTMTGTFGALIGHGVLPIDLARTADGKRVAVIAAGNGHTKELPQVHLLQAAQATDTGTCTIPRSPSIHGTSLNATRPVGQAVAVAFTPDSTQIAVFTREPAALHLRTIASFDDTTVPWTTIPLGGESREDSGHAVFHSNTGGGIACASCHPSGADDGRVWKFSTGERRTQTLQGTLAGMAPYHWSGDAPGLETFASEVFVKKMAGPELAVDQVGALRSWLERIPAAPVSTAVDAAKATRGKAVFEREDVGCTTCHNGPKFSNNESADVGTGDVFQVPSLLNLAVRAPYLHDGRAKTLEERFTTAEPGKHGHTTDLTPAEFQDLIAYLESL